MKHLLIRFLWLSVTAAQAADPEPGATIFGERRFIEYVAGNLPVVLVAPHGGRMQSEEIPDRVVGVKDADANTQELARAIAEVLHERTRRHVHLVICRLHRSKLDANREIGEAAGGHPIAGQAWRDHHRFIEQARASAVARFGLAFLIDLHGHAHPSPRVELGYLHAAEDYAREAAFLNGQAFRAAGSLALAASWSRRPYIDLLRGPLSLGALLEQGGFRATPSPSVPEPIGPYFRGGYTVARHCRAEERTTGLQIECYRTGLRDTALHRLAFARALATALERFLPEHLGLTLRGEPASR